MLPQLCACVYTHIVVATSNTLYRGEVFEVNTAIKLVDSVPTNAAIAGGRRGCVRYVSRL